jgi:putative DNA primase/helicase
MPEPFLAWVQRARAAKIEDEIARRGILLKRVGAEYIGPCPVCGGDDRYSFNVKEQLWNCRGCKKGGDIIDLVKHLDGVDDFIAACTTLAGPPPKANGKDRASKPREIVVAEYLYDDESGNVIFASERIEYQNPDGTFVLKDGKHKKSFRQKRPDPAHAGRWIYNIDGCRVLPYRLPALIEGIGSNGHPILIVEGEAKADLLASWNVAATCCAGGAKKWKPEHSSFLKDADVVIVPDNDNPGCEHMNLVGNALSGIAKRVRVLWLPELADKGDIIDWANAGGTREQLDQLIAEAPIWEAPPAEELDKEKKAAAEQSEDDLLDALSKMRKGVEFDRERKRLAKQLDVRPSAIDAEIEERQAEAQTTALLHGHWYVEPWPEPVEGDALIRDIIRKLLKHVVISYDGALAIALWIILAWVHDEVATHSPILHVTAADPDSGKSTTLAVASFLMPRAICTVDISKAALYRSIQRWQPSFAIDEFDDVLSADSGSDKSELRSVINSGHTRGQGVLRCITDDHKPELFSTFCPKAICMIGREMPPATLSRCITVELRRRKKSERIVKFKHEDDSELADLRGRLRRYAMDNAEALRNAEPSMPEGFENRCADNWRVQFAIADLAGEDWGDRARAAAIKIEGGSDKRTISARALADARAVFYPKDEKGLTTADPLERISSADLVAQLCAYNDSPWAEWKRGKPITPAQLARLLKPFGIAPQVIRLPGEGTMRGYLRAQFEDAWDRHL